MEVLFAKWRGYQKRNPASTRIQPDWKCALERFVASTVDLGEGVALYRPDGHSGVQQGLQNLSRLFTGLGLLLIDQQTIGTLLAAKFVSVASMGL